MRTCSVYGCLTTKTTAPGLGYFSLPHNIERRKQWLHLIDRKDLLDKPARSYQVCEKHFNVNDILQRSSRRRLKVTAVPLLYLPEVATDDDSEEIIIIEEGSCDSSQNSNSNPAKLTENHADNQINLFDRLPHRFLTKELQDTVKAFFQHHQLQNRNDTDYIIFCLNLYLISPQSYQLLQQAISLPCPKKLKLALPITSEVNEKVLMILKNKVDSMADLEKNCSVIVYPVKLSKKLFYDIKKDTVIGFHDINGVQSPRPAEEALVVMVQGIFTSWNIPVTYALLGAARNYDQIEKWIDQLLEKLFEIGLTIRTFVSNMDIDFYKIAKNRGIFAEKPYFFINERKIYYIFEVPHLMVLLRNAFVSFDFRFQKCVAKCGFVRQLYDFEKRKTVKLAPNLTERHVERTNCKGEDVRYASELLSIKVASGLSTYIDSKAISDSGRDTVQFIQLMGNLYNCLNSSKLNDDNEYKRALCGERSQLDLLIDMLDTFQDLRMVDPKTGCNVKSSVKFIEGFRITIASILLLFDDLKEEGGSYLLTSHLNYNQSEKLFSRTVAKEPTSKQFRATFREIFFRNVIKPIKKDNCEDTTERLVHNLEQRMKREPIGQNVAPLIVSVDDRVLLMTIMNKYEVSSLEYNKIKLPEEDTLVYVSGFLLKQCAEKHKECDKMKLFVKRQERLSKIDDDYGPIEGDDVNYFKYKVNSTESCQSISVVPCEDFVQYIEKLEVEFKNCFRRRYFQTSIMVDMFEELSKVLVQPPCPCFPTAYLIKLLIRMGIFNTLKYNNRAYRTGKRRNGFLIAHL